MSDETRETALPCPFCGGPAYVVEFSDGEVSIGCKTAECMAEAHSYGQPQAALAAWNRRAALRSPVAGTPREETETIGFVLWDAKGGTVFRSHVYPFLDLAERALAGVVWHSRDRWEVRTAAVLRAAASSETPLTWDMCAEAGFFSPIHSVADVEHCLNVLAALRATPAATTESDLMPRAVSNEELADWGRSMTGGDTSHMESEQ